MPITLYSDPLVIGWGFAFYIAVLAKLPLGFFVPKQQSKVPKGYPFNPYWRDFLITGLAMTSRGEFSFIIASFAIGVNLISESLYASVVWAVLLSAITSPFMLLSTIRFVHNDMTTQQVTILHFFAPSFLTFVHPMYVSPFVK